MSHTILVVDDDPQVRGLCRLTLEEDGHLVKEATNGKIALAELRETSIDLIVLDLCMPEMEGFEFLKAVRGESSNPKIIVMSGFMGGTMLRAAKLYGAAATLVKPFSPESLLSLVDQVLAENAPEPASD